MKKISDYQEHAHQCRILAASAAIREHRELLSKMAETWDSLAKDREQRLARQQRTSELEAAIDPGANLKTDT